MISGLLQTPAYARALFSAFDPSRTSDLVDELVAIRLARQERFLLDTVAPLLIVVLDEAVIREVVGSFQVMHEQLAHLLRVGNLANVVVQVTPFSSVEPTQHKGDMTLLTLPGGSEHLCSESLSRGHFNNDPEGLAKRTQSYERLRAHALSAPESRRLIRGAMEELINVGPEALDPSGRPWSKSAYDTGLSKI